MYGSFSSAKDLVVELIKAGYASEERAGDVGERMKVEAVDGFCDEAGEEEGAEEGGGRWERETSARRGGRRRRR